MVFSADTLLDLLHDFPVGSRFAVAYSGGLDSTVLLHAMHHALSLAQARSAGAPVYSLRAIHVNHGLSVHADQWQVLCEQTCAHLGVPLHVERVRIDPDEGASLESLAREKRYAVFERQLAEGECLLMAHHLDDQAETFLLRTLRGAGPRGLSAIPQQRPLGRGLVLRPLLELPRDVLRDYAEREALAWVDDESNESLMFDRNFCRHSILPVLESRWPGYRESWKRSAQLSAEADVLLDELAAIDYAQVKSPMESVIDATALAALGPARQRNVLRYWLSLTGAPDPGWNVLMHIVDDMIPAAAGSHPEIRWRNETTSVVVRRFRQHLYLKKQLDALDDITPIAWQPEQSLHLPGNGLIYALAVKGEGLVVPDAAELNLRYRQGGESCRLHGRRTRSLKKILQDAGIEPWLRDRIPLVYCADELVCVPGVGVVEGWKAASGAPGWRVVWVPPDISVSR
ncbi:MAG: tRNA lysidine(34) synthetase TilS [Pseudomonadales bacterium]|nr:tRNA lysidine(34) synthetase TilS [Pseudomonadales bacterium]MCP5358073.1 tRNA lysidine(34) synthetase TilS [Pseudomonadales bacterium]